MRISVQDLMIPVTAVVAETASFAQARDLLIRERAAEVYVTDPAGRLRGVVPDYEFLKAELAGLAPETPILTLLSAKIETVAARADVGLALAKFREAWCGRIAVTEDGRLVGHLFRADALRLAVALRQAATTTQLTAEKELLAGPHFARRAGAKRLTRLSAPRRIRRLASH